MAVSKPLQALTELALGEVAHIHSLGLEHDPTKLMSQLQHSGFVRGETVEIVRRGSGKNGNLVVRLGGHTHFALRVNEANLIFVSAQAPTK